VHHLGFVCLVNGVFEQGLITSTVEQKAPGHALPGHPPCEWVVRPQAYGCTAFGQQYSQPIAHSSFHSTPSSIHA
jgi:hypothetical protein